MPTRRLVLGALIATPFLAALRGLAGAAPRPPGAGEIFEGELIVAPDKTGPSWHDPTYRVRPRGRARVPTPDGNHVAAGRRLRLRRAHLFSISNRNNRYVAYLDLRARVRSAMTWLVVPGGAAVSARSWGDRTVHFEIDRDQAVALAATWGIDVRDRAPLGEGLVAHWRTRDHHTAPGAPIAIELEIENTRATPAYVSVGGHQRGPRDNRFTFTATDASGAAVPALDAYDLGGLMYYAEVEPGEPVRVSTELQRYLTIDRGGAYDVTCRYKAELVTNATGGAGWPEHGHETWELELTGHLDVRVE